MLWGPPLALSLWLYGSSIKALLVCSTIYCLSLGSSIILYRLSPFHPLAKYPGPVLCKVSRLWTAYLSWTGQQHRYYHHLHQKYGPVIRTGPNHLHMCEAKAIPTILGPG